MLLADQVISRSRRGGASALISEPADLHYYSVITNMK
jgi:hypothetical protein